MKKIETPVEKNKEYIVEIIDNGYEGEGIAKIENFTIFIPNAIKGEKVKILIIKVLTSHAFGKVIEFIKESENRIESECETYKRCGGCNLRHIKYEETLNMKKNMVQAAINKMVKQKVEIKDTIGMEEPFYYRNKAQFPVCVDKTKKAVMGIYAKRTHEIIPIKKCFIQKEISQEISKTIYEFILKNNIEAYNERTQKGLLRHIVIKVGVKTNQIMCVLVINGKKLPKQEALTKILTEKYPEIKAIYINTNTNNTNVILGQINVNIYGEKYITDNLGEYSFKISPLSFYQVNPIQAEKLYKLGIEEVNISKEDIVFDLYCGIGTISLFASKYAKKVYGIEFLKEAVETATENAKLNNVTNTEFVLGDVEKTLTELIYDKNIIPDVVIVDPPRKGLDNISIENLLKAKPKKILYISCNPATLARDLSKLEEAYIVNDITPVDMFPFTVHVECCSVLSLKNTIQ